jgi:predicted amidophosphoribosyltransferase
MDRAVREGRFRTDLFHRLRVLPLHVPALRDRAGDLPALVRRLLADLAGSTRGVPKVTPGAMAALAAYDWPGNVRELRHVLERAVMAGATNTIDVADLPAELVSPERTAAGIVVPRPTLDELERHIEFILRETKGNQSRAASVLGSAGRRSGKSASGGKGLPVDYGLRTADHSTAEPQHSTAHSALQHRSTPKCALSLSTPSSPPSSRRRACCGAVLESPTSSPVCPRAGGTSAERRRRCAPLRRGARDCRRARRVSARPLADLAPREPGPYEGVLRDLVHAIKFDHRRSLATPLGVMPGRLPQTCWPTRTRWCLPLHPWRLWRRGFNQAEDVARALSDIGCPCWRDQACPRDLAAVSASRRCPACERARRILRKRVDRRAKPRAIPPRRRNAGARGRRHDDGATLRPRRAHSSTPAQVKCVP